MALAFSALRAVGRLVIAGLAKEGLGANAIIRQLGNLSLTYRRATMLEDIWEFSAMRRIEGMVRGVAWNVVFPQHAMIEMYLPKARKYRVFGIATLTDPRTGEETEKAVSFYTNKRDSKNDWLESFMSEYQLGYDEQAQALVDFEVTHVAHQAGWRY